MTDPADRETTPEPATEDTRAKTLPRTLPIADEPALLPARMVNEVLYCERLFYLEWVQGEWDENYFTADGTAVHARVDSPGRTKGRAEPNKTTEVAPDDPPYRARSVWLSSERLGLTAKIDVVETDAGSAVTPIEYKRGHKPDVPGGAWLPERAQICAHVLLLRDNGFRCEGGAIYYAASRQRVPITVDDELIAATREAIVRARVVARSRRLPPPLFDSPKCNHCSLVGICLPDEVNLVHTLGMSNDAPDDAPVVEEARIRQMYAAKDDRVPLYVSDQGAYVKLSAECLVVKPREGEETEVRLPNTSQVCVFGNVQVSSQVVRALLDRGIPLLFFTTGGWFLGRIMGHDSKNVELRIAQHEVARDLQKCLELSRRFVESKILNCRTMLRRNHREAPAEVLFELKQLARKASEATSIDSLLGLEGTAARCYFGSFAGMLGTNPLASGTFDFDGRNRRPPRDPLNALLSLAYSLLSKDFAVTCTAVGLDAGLGFFHRPRFGRPALALDLMEEFRPLAADSVVINAVNTGVVTQEDFLRHEGACALNTPARRRFIHAYERRMDQLVTHPTFGYRVSYRRVLELQARLLGRHLLGEIANYPPFRTR